MEGSTLEAMADAVEKSQIIVFCLLFVNVYRYLLFPSVLWFCHYFFIILFFSSSFSPFPISDLIVIVKFFRGNIKSLQTLASKQSTLFS